MVQGYWRLLRARHEVASLVRKPAELDIWSRDFFRDAVKRIRLI
jgi:hypothetical protein